MKALADKEVASTVSAYFRAIESGDLQGWFELFTDDAVCHDPVGAMPVEGGASLEEVWKAHTSTFHTLSMGLDAVFYGGRGAAVKWTGRGRGVNKREVRFEGITVFELAPSGKIQTLMAYWDPAAMMINLAGESTA